MKKFILLTLAFTMYMVSSLNSTVTNQYWVPSIYKGEGEFEHPKIQEALLDPTQLECMAKNIYFEAAIESTAGKLAVAQVTLNRVNSTRFPNTICGVVKQGSHYSNGFAVRDRCQFSWYCDGKSDEPRKDSKEWFKAKEYARIVLSGRIVLDVTEGATHYHATYVKPAWAKTKTRTTRIESHIFYRWEK